MKKFLEEQGCWQVKFFANAYTKSGIPDLLVCCNGYFLGVELKAPNGKPSELQKWNVRKINESGGFAVILPPDEFEYFKHVVSWLKCCQTDEAREIVTDINERWGV